MRISYIFSLSLALVFFASEANAGPSPTYSPTSSPTPTRTPPPPPAPLRHVAFVTSTVYSGNLGGLAGADAKCNTLASQVTALHGIQFLAILSDSSINARERFRGPFQIVAPIFNTAGAKVAENEADLWDGTLLAHIDYNESGVKMWDIATWTGTSPDGSKHNPTASASWTEAYPGLMYNSWCQNWRDASSPDLPSWNGGAGLGRAYQVDSRWVRVHDPSDTNQVEPSCNYEFNLYCLSQPFSPGRPAGF